MAEKDASNSTKAAKKVPGKPFEKGKSGNPNGRPKVPKELREACKEFTPEAIEILINMAKSPKTKDSDKLKAIDIILDRGYGKAFQSVEMDMKSIPQVVFVGADNVPD